MSKVKLILPLCLLLTLFSFSYFEKDKDKIQEIINKMQFINGGWFNQGMIPSIELTPKDTTLLYAHCPRRVKVEPFYISKTEVTNAEWKLFFGDMVLEMGEENARLHYYPDTTHWLRDWGLYPNDSFESYFCSKAFDDYPVNGISWHQAQDYCRWLTDKYSQYVKESHRSDKIIFRLPTEDEWEYAAYGLTSRPQDNSGFIEDEYFGWEPYKEFCEDGYIANFGRVEDLNGMIVKDFGSDGYVFTSPVGTYNPNRVGLFDMSGNVAEWVQDTFHIYNCISSDEEQVVFLSAKQIEDWIEEGRKESPNGNPDQSYEYWSKMLAHDKSIIEGIECKFAKGGSYGDGLVYMQVGVRQGYDANAKSSKVGFRIAASCNKITSRYLVQNRWKRKKK